MSAPVSMSGIARGVIGAMSIPKSDIHEALEQAQHSQGLIERCGLYPYVVTVRTMSLSGAIELISKIQMVRNEGEIDAVLLVPLGSQLLAEAFYPVEYLHQLPVTQRGNFSAAYRAYVEWRQLRSGRKEIDPIRADEDVQNWLRPGRHVGD